MLKEYIRTTGKDIFFKRLLILLSLTIVVIWFRSGTLFLTAEEGMIFYSPERTLSLASYVWQEVGTGFLDPTTISRVPIFFITFLFNRLLPTNVVQALFFFFIIFSGIYGTYLVSKYFTKSASTSFIAATFYLFNIFTMTQVFARSLFVGMLAWAYLPIFLYFWIQWINEGKIKYLVKLLVVGLFYTYAFSTPAFLLTIFTPAALYSFYRFLAKDSKKEVFYRSVGGIISWALVNLWWVYPLVTLSTSALSQHSSLDLNLESLRGVSSHFPIIQVLQLRQKFYFELASNPDPQWGNWYESVFSFALTLTIFLISLYGVKILRKKKSAFQFLLSLFLIALFISKGTNPPLGKEFYEILFKNVSFSAVLRNSYEKFGIALLLPYSIFFASGIYRLRTKIRSYRNLVLFMALILFNVILVWPMWNRSVFQDYAWIKPPDYYEEVNKYFLENDQSDGRVLILPMIPFHGLKYSWGYRGDESSRYFYDKVAISKNLKADYYYTKYEQLTNAMIERLKYRYSRNCSRI